MVCRSALQKRVEMGVPGSQKMRQQVKIPCLPAEKVGFFQTFQYRTGPVQAVGIFQRRAVCNGQEKVPVLGSEAVGIEIADIGGIVLIDIAIPQQIFQ